MTALLLCCLAQLPADDLVYSRAEERLNRGEAQAVADEMTAVLDRKRAAYAARVAGHVARLAGSAPGPSLELAFVLSRWQHLHRRDWLAPLDLRAKAWRALGRPDAAEADAALSDAIHFEMHADDAPRTLDRDASRRAWLVGWSVTTGVLFVALVPAFVLIGGRQRREAGGTWLRLVGVATALAALQVLPLAVAVVVGQYVQGEPATGRLVIATAIVSVVWFSTLRGNLLPLAWEPTGEPLPPLEDPAVLARVRELAEAMGLRPPPARLVRSGSSEQLNQGAVAGLAAPTLVLFDGILNRLSEDERDAVLAHELAHLANGSFWVSLLAGAACAAAVVATAPSLHPIVLFTFWAALWTGTSIALSRWLELDCDRRAARAIGHRKTASALFKIHADEPYRSSAVLEFLIGATADHPSRDERLAAIHADAPTDDKPPVEWHPGGPERRRLAARLAAILWLGGIAVSLAAAWTVAPNHAAPAVPLTLIAATPTGLLWLGVRKAQRRQARLEHRPFAWRTFLGWAFVAFFVSRVVVELFVPASEGGSRGWLTVASLTTLAVLLLSWHLTGPGKAAKLNQKLGVAIHAGDWAKALEHCEGDPDLVATDDDLRYNQALIKAALGRRIEAITELERLREDRPRYKLTLVALIDLYADEGHVEAALALAKELTTALPGDALGVLTESWLLRKLGRADEAEAAIRAGLKIEPDAAQGPLTRAGLAVDRGDVPQARRELERAERLSPGTVPVALMAVEVALAAGDPDLEGLLARARRAVRTTPLAFAEKALAALERRVAAPVADGQ